MGRDKMRLIWKVLLAALMETIIYIFLHEGGHALVAALCGATITSFSILGAHTSSTGGNFTQTTSSLLCLAGMLLPLIFSACYMLFCFNKLWHLFFWHGKRVS